MTSFTSFVITVSCVNLLVDKEMTEFRFKVLVFAVSSIPGFQHTRNSFKMKLHHDLFLFPLFP